MAVVKSPQHYQNIAYTSAPPVDNPDTPDLLDALYEQLQLSDMPVCEGLQPFLWDVEDSGGMTAFLMDIALVHIPTGK